MKKYKVLYHYEEIIEAKNPDEAIEKFKQLTGGEDEFFQPSCKEYRKSRKK